MINKAYSYLSNFNFSSAAYASVVSQSLSAALLGVGVSTALFNSY
ncbi:hypothetical protein SJAV_20070 [Sulfurisphaera javensis]|uniref:Uncharacterized protein n=1 Tax=Sulfurisphaera javensis TaxID=2049879 RepID=A0AAT9GTC9_9CREN